MGRCSAFGTPASLRPWLVSEMGKPKLDSDTLVCAAVVDCLDPIHGSSVEHCALCDIEVYVAPSGQRLLKMVPSAKIWCSRCEAKADLSNADRQGYPPGAVQEIREHELRKKRN